MDWNNDGKKDLIVGQTQGYVYIFLNTSTDSNPIFDNGARVQGYNVQTPPGTGDLRVKGRAIAEVNDWNEDGKKDLIIGDAWGNIWIYLNQGTDANPDFGTSTPSQVQVNGVNWYPPDIPGDGDTDYGRAAPKVFDWDRDGLKDLLVGEYYGYVYFLKNVGTNSEPVFNSADRLRLSDGNYLRYLDSANPNNPRSRLYVSDWNNDNVPDLLLGGWDGRLMLFQAEPPPCTDADGDGYYCESECGSDVDCDCDDPSINPAATEINNDGIDNDCNPSTPTASASGNGYNYPVPLFRASLNLNTTTGALSYYYTRLRLSLISTSMTGVVASGGTATVTGEGKVNGVPGCTYTATVTSRVVGTDAMGITIVPGGSCTTSYSAAPLFISGGGGYTVVGQ